MKFNVQERLFLLKVLPVKGTIVTSKIVDNFRSNLSFSEYELTNWEIVTESNGSVTYDIDKAGIVDIDTGDILKEMIIRGLINFSMKVIQNQNLQSKNMNKENI